MRAGIGMCVMRICIEMGFVHHLTSDTDEENKACQDCL